MSQRAKRVSTSVRHKVFEPLDRMGRAVFDASPRAMLLAEAIDGDFPTLAVNPAWEVQFGISQQEVRSKTGKHFKWWLSMDDRHRFVTQLFESGWVNDFAVWQLRKDGTPFLVSVSGVVHDMGDWRLTIIVYDDITLTYQMQRRLSGLNHFLEHKVEERTAELSAALQHLRHTQDELIQSSKMAALGRMVIGIAHELNTPLGNAITAASSIQADLRQLQGDIPERLTRSKLIQYVDFACEGSDLVLSGLQRSVELVSSLKEINFDPDNQGLQKLYVHDFVDEWLVLHRSRLLSGKVFVSVDIDKNLYILTFRTALIRVLDKLIDNAFKHGFQGDHELASIDIRAYETENGRVDFIFKDNGKGLDMPDLSKVFEPFFRGSMSMPGNGLGLFVAHVLVTVVLKGTLEVKSAPGQGAEFIISMPQLH
ncbi:PAS domain-containing sensor histidine kinase [Nitrincola sp. MINF-07-Sa-05]|uniref:PAS domain-containing sensor histidine kinase n=1 Tax=Nitrincola salilacus TaxID=3400273 RepID=UPI0039180572